MQILIGLYQEEKEFDTDGWRILLEQEKIPYTTVHPEKCPVIVCEKEVPDWLETYMEQGGIAVITGAQPEQMCFEIAYIGKAALEFIDLPGKDGANTRIQTTVTVFDGEGEGVLRLHEKRITKLGLTPDEYPVWLYHSFGKGGCFYSGVPFSQQIGVLGDTLRKTDNFSDYEERVTSVDKHKLLKEMRRVLEQALAERGLPYVSLAYYPKNYESVFCFRVDVDGIYGDNLKKISQAGKENGIRMSFFVNRTMCEPEKERLSDIDSFHEVGNHAVIHNLYTSYKDNLENVCGCRDWLKRRGIQSVPGFVAPRGMWNYSLNKALEDAGMLYTSDFGFCIFGLPFYPYCHGNRMKVMQIPVNPFSTERANIQAKDRGEELPDAEYVAQYFIQSFDWQCALGMPVILYSHPQCFGRLAEAVIPRLKKEIDKKHIWCTTLTEWSRWWEMRDEVCYRAEFTEVDGSVQIDGKIPEDICVEIRKEALCRRQGRKK